MAVLQAAQRILFASCGVNMNTFFVGNHPVGHYVEDFTKAPSKKSSSEATKSTTETSKASTSVPLQQDLATRGSSLVDGEKTFFMKARIMAGQADLAIAKEKNVEDFKWVSKDEVEKLVDPEYWIKVKNMLVAQ